MALDTRILIDAKHSVPVTFEYADTEFHRLIKPSATLRVLSIIEVSQVPLHIVLGSPWRLSSSSIETRAWLSSILLQSPPEESHVRRWWEDLTPNSPYGILIAVDTNGLVGDAPYPGVTELLVYASNERDDFSRPPTPPPSSPHSEAEHVHQPGTRLAVKALPLCSDLLYRPEALEPSPPSSPLLEANDHDIDAVFLPMKYSTEPETIHEPPVKRRRTAVDAFNEATERQKAIRRGGTTSATAAAAARANEDHRPSLNHRRSLSGQSQPNFAPTRTLSRSPSVASTRPSTAVQHKSSLSKVQSTSNSAGPESTIESKNKDFVSRTVMAGMRLFGLSQSKKRRPSRSAATALDPPQPSMTSEEAAEEKRGDEEFKLIYHQVCKGVCFAFRNSLTSQSLLAHSDAVRETTDRLLVIFCNDPLGAGKGKFNGDEKVTPGGRKAFGSANGGEKVEESPFAGG